jgi:CxxC motif-containing protein (DUF1111 family)
MPGDGTFRVEPKRVVAAACALVLLVGCAVLIVAQGERDPPSAAVRGGQLFTAKFTAEQGLGPLFNDRACAGCHLEPAVGGMGRDGLATVVRVGKLTPGGFVVGRRGPVAPGHSIAELGVACDRQAGIPAGVNITSVRNAPPLFGSGLVDSIPAAVIRAGAVAKGDGVRGRPNLVRGPDGHERVGRFGWKAHVPTLELFVAEAFRSELGLTSPLAPAAEPASTRAAAGPCAEKSAASEVDREDLAAVVAFLASLPAPEPQRSASAGAMVFRQTGCAACHVPTLRARTREVPLYSDLLLHDMGRTLDDGVVQGSAAGPEWRTTPLWGLSDRTRFLHDGRARTLEAAILDHGGEAQRARQRFRSLSGEQRRSLLAFLRTL